MFRHLPTILLAGLLNLSAISSAAQTPPSATTPASATVMATDAIVLTVDGRNYTAAELDAIVAGIVPPGTQINGAVRRRVADMIVETRLLADEAARRGLDRDPRVQPMLAFAHDQALGQAVAYQLAEELLEHEARDYYEAHRDGFEQIRARHILIRTPDSPVPSPPGKPALTAEEAKAKADEIRQELLNGADFAKLAAAESYDPSASQGGELSPFRRMQMAPEFENAAFATKVGEISAPVKSIFGYHIIQVLERGPAPFDDVKVEIARLLERSNFDKFLRQLKQAHPATLSDSYFGPAAERSPPPPSSPLRRRGS